MTLTIDLSDEDVTALAAKARAQGVTAEPYARLVLEHDLKSGPARRPVSQAIREIWSDMPADARAKLPRDGASQVDHYVYGLPKTDFISMQPMRNEGNTGALNNDRHFEQMSN